MSEPSLDLFYDQLCSRYEWDLGALGSFAGLASGLVVGTNPPYGLLDFFSFYPKFGGALVTVNGDLTSGSAIVANTNTTGLAAGMLLAARPGIAAGATIQSVDSGTQFTLSLGATATAAGAKLEIFANPLVPLAVVNAYIALASASLLQPRWGDAWQIAMGLYVAHFVTLWLRSDGDTYSTPGKAAAAGLARGITVSKSAGGVSQGLQVTPGLEAWGSWTQTSYGEQLASMAKVVGSGPIWIY
jgi:hypothetical protein